MKVRHYRNRCREMGITPDETLIEQILDPDDRLRGRAWRRADGGPRVALPRGGLRLRSSPRPTTEQLVAAVNSHVAEAHDSFELEDVIEAVLEEAPDA